MLSLTAFKVFEILNKTI